MNFKFLVNIPKLHVSSENNRRTNFEPTTNVDSSVATLQVERRSKQNAFQGVNLWGWPPLSLVPWAINIKEKISTPATINKELKKRTSYRVEKSSGGGNPLRFRPYMSKVPWHTGARAFLSQLFPRYGYYCGPNWSSGKDRGSLIWDRRPIDLLDYCCYCHDIGYDTHDQAKLLEADMAFLECLERPHMTAKGDVHIAHIYKTMCITGLKNILIPYRMHLLKLHSGQPLMNFGWLSNVKWRSWNFQKT